MNISYLEQSCQGQSRGFCTVHAFLQVPLTSPVSQTLWQGGPCGPIPEDTSHSLCCQPGLPLATGSTPWCGSQAPASMEQPAVLPEGKPCIRRQLAEDHVCRHRPLGGRRLTAVDELVWICLIGWRYRVVFVCEAVARWVINHLASEREPAGGSVCYGTCAKTENVKGKFKKFKVVMSLETTNE